MTSRLPPLSQAELRALYDKLVRAGQVVLSTDWKPPHRSVRELVENIRKERQ